MNTYSRIVSSLYSCNWLARKAICSCPNRQLSFQKLSSGISYSRLNFQKSSTGTFIDHLRQLSHQPSTTMRKELDPSYYVLPLNTPICLLDATDAFKNLTAKERLYAHYLCRASFDGALIVLLQTSPEAPYLFALFSKLFRDHTIEDLRKTATEQCQFSEDEFKAILVYAGGMFSNMGNYRGFGDTKITPDFKSAKFGVLIKALSDAKLSQLWSKVENKIGSLNAGETTLGYSEKGVTTYLSHNVTEADIKVVDKYLASKNYEAWNTRLFKTIGGDGQATYEIRHASINPGELTPPEVFEGCTFKRITGDYSPILKRVVANLVSAKKYAANPHQEAMLDEYVKHFTSGRVEEHKDGSRHWIKDKGPTVESYIGFIENYRDPAGTRSEFEGFVAAVDKEMSKKFEELVNRATEILPRLPWDKEYEKDAFLKPDFTSLDVIAFGSNGIPAGINIPNYDDIRQNEGFKNVSLGNVIAAFPNVKINFVSEEDAALIKKYHKEAFEVQVGLHELLGHGSGKLFQKNKDGTFNFDVDKTIDMETGETITSWYEEGETWGSKFTQLGSAYEECRAEAVGYCLCTYPDVLRIFGHEGEEAENIKYVNWLSEMRAGLMSTEFYNPETKKWGQAHCHARLVLLRVAMEPNDGFVTCTKFDGEDGKPDLDFTVDRAKISSGYKSTMEFLKKLQLYKSTGNFTKGKALFDKYAEMTPELLEWRDIVIARRQPRRLFVQPNTKVAADQSDVMLQNYPETIEGVVESIVDRYANEELIDSVVELADKDLPHFKPYFD